jgi:hypothetical protein
VYYLPVIVRKYNRKLNFSAPVLIIIPLREFGKETHEETNGLQPPHSEFTYRTERKDPQMEIDKAVVTLLTSITFFTSLVEEIQSS